MNSRISSHSYLRIFLHVEVHKSNFEGTQSHVHNSLVHAVDDQDVEREVHVEDGARVAGDHGTRVVPQLGNDLPKVAVLLTLRLQIALY